eukprot:COSAG02_NODE_22943_length_735_cov_0.930818_2_plen_109_part_01
MHRACCCLAGDRPHSSLPHAGETVSLIRPQAGKAADGAADGKLSAELSEAFLVKAQEQIKSVDAFVAEQKKELAAEYSRVKSAHSAAMENPPLLTAPDADGGVGARWTV